MRTMETMTPAHTLWDEFIERLEGPEGCNFQEDEHGKITWRCMGGSDKSFATAILETMLNIDVAGSLRFFERYGGYCDCEILFNVEAGWAALPPLPNRPLDVLVGV